MKFRLIILFFLINCRSFGQYISEHKNKLQIDFIIENRYAIISYGYEKEGVFIYDLIKDKLIKYLDKFQNPSLTKDKKRLTSKYYNNIFDIKNGSLVTNKLKLDEINFDDLFNANSGFTLSIDEYTNLQRKKKNLKVATETLEKFYYNSTGDYHSSAGSPGYNNDNRKPESEQIRFSFPYLIDTLLNDSFGVFNLKKQTYSNTHRIVGYKLKSANISPKQTFYYATLNKINDEKYYHYIFNIANNKYVNLYNYDTSKCSESDIHRVSFSANDSFFATINTCEKAFIYKRDSALKQYCINDENELIARIEFSPKSKYFITYSVYENDTTSFYKYFFLTYDSAEKYYYPSTKYSMTRLEKPLYYVKIWDSKTMQPILKLRTSSIKFGFSEDDNFLAIKNENIMLQTFFGNPRDNCSFYKDTVYHSYLSIIDLNSKKEIKQLNVFDKYDVRLEYIRKRQKRPYFIFSSDNKKIVTNYNEDYPQNDSKYDDIYYINNGSSLLKKLVGGKE